MIKNMLSNNYFINKIENNFAFIYKACFECVNVQTLQKSMSNNIGFYAKWKREIFGFYSGENNTTYLYNPAAFIFCCSKEEVLQA